MRHLTPLVWHHDVWHMKVALHFELCERVCVCLRQVLQKALSRKTLTATTFSVLPAVHLKTATVGELHTFTPLIFTLHPYKVHTLVIQE